MTELELSLFGASLTGDEAPDDAVLPELLVCFNLLPTFGGSLETRKNFGELPFGVGQEGWSAADALCAVWSIPETGSTLFGMASGPRDTIGSPLGAESVFTCLVDGNILRADSCIATSVRPGWMVYIPGDPVTHEVVRLVSVDTCQIEEPSTVSGVVQVRFVAAFGRDAAKNGLKVETIGATTIVGPCNPAGSAPGARVNGPLAAIVGDEESGATVPRWISIVRPAWPGFDTPPRCAGLAVWKDGRLVGLFGNKLLVSGDGGGSFSVAAEFVTVSPRWLIAHNGTVLIGGDQGQYGVIWRLEDAFVLSEVYRRNGWRPQFAATALGGSGDHKTVVLWEKEVDGVLSVELDFLSGVPPTVSLNVPLSAGIGADGVPFGIHAGNRPFQLAPALSGVFLATELGEVYRVETTGQVVQQDGGSASRTVSTTPFRLERGGPWYTTCKINTPLRTRPYFLSASSYADNRWACIMADLKTFFSDGKREVSGLYVMPFGSAEIEPLRDGGVPVHPLNPVTCLGPLIQQAWVDEHAQLFFGGERSDYRLNFQTTSVIQYGHVWHLDDRGVGTSVSAPGPVFTREVKGAVGNMRILSTGHVVDNGNPPSIVADFSALGDVTAVASSGSEAVVVLTNGACFWDGSSWSTIPSPPDPVVSGAWNEDGFVFLSEDADVLVYQPGSGWFSLGSGITGEPVVAAASAPNLSFFFFGTGVVVVSGVSSLSVCHVPVGEQIVAGCCDEVSGVWTLYVVTTTGKIFKSDPPYSGFTEIASVPFRKCIMARPADGAVMLAPGLGFPVTLTAATENSLAPWFCGISIPDPVRAFQSGFCLSSFGVPIAKPVGQTAWYLVDVGQPRAQYTAAVMSGSTVGRWAASCPSGLASVGSASEEVHVTLVPGSSGIGIAGDVAVVCTDGGIVRIFPDGSVDGVDSDGPAVYVGGAGGEVFVVRTFETTIVRENGEERIATPEATAAAAAAGRVLIVGPEEYAVCTASGDLTTYEPPPDGVTSPVPVAGTVDPVVLAYKGAVSSRWRSPSPVQRLYVYRGGVGWKEIGPTLTDATAAVFTGSRITASAGASMSDFSAWGGGDFRPVSEMFWSPVWAVTGGQLVLFGVTEIEEGRLVYHRRRVRWSAPLAPFDFDTLESSGLADLYPDTGDFLAAVSLPTGIIYADESGLGILEPTFEPEAPFSHRRIADIPKPITQMVAVGSSAFFVAADDFLWQATAAGANRVRRIAFERIFKKRRADIVPALFFVPKKGLFVTDLSGSERFAFISVPEGRITGVALTRTPEDQISIVTALDGTALGYDVLFSASPLGSVVPRILLESTETTGFDTISGEARPWFFSIMTPPVASEATVSNVAVDITGSPNVSASVVEVLVVDSTEAFWQHPAVALPAERLSQNTYRMVRPVGSSWKTPISLEVDLWSPWWSGLFLDNDGSLVPFTPLSDLRVRLDIPGPGMVTFTGLPDCPIQETGGIAVDYWALPIAHVSGGDDPWTVVVSPDPLHTDWVAVSSQSARKGWWAKRGGLGRLLRRPRILVFGQPAGWFSLSKVRIEVYQTQTRGFAEADR